MYRKNWKGDERYPNGEFLSNDQGKQIYARDRKGNQYYPKRNKNVFARDGFDECYYAKDKFGNEYYPIKNKKSLLVKDSLNSNVRLALYADGTQRYPIDSKGNEYYLTDENQRPFILKKKDGEVYFAKNRKGYPMIPWNCIENINEPLVYTWDSAGNLVYIKESLFPTVLHPLIRFVCNVTVICPRYEGCIGNCIQ